jgi:periplasmic divalent cation tolerance protein
MKISLVYITFDKKEEADSLCNLLVQERLVAGVHLYPIEAIFHWKQEVVHRGEFLAVVQTSVKLWPMLRDRIEVLHSFEVPCIMMVESEVNDSFARWIDTETGPL